MQGERPGHSLQATALVHEAYLRLTGMQELNWQNRAQFFAISAQVMRRILVDSARARCARKRGVHAEFFHSDETPRSPGQDRNREGTPDLGTVYAGGSEPAFFVPFVKVFGTNGFSAPFSLCRDERAESSRNNVYEACPIRVRQETSRCRHVKSLSISHPTYSGTREAHVCMSLVNSVYRWRLLISEYDNRKWRSLCAQPEVGNLQKHKFSTKSMSLSTGKSSRPHTQRSPGRD